MASRRSRGRTHVTADALPVGSLYVTAIRTATTYDLIVSLDEALSQADVDARVAAGVADWAEDGNTDLIPDAKLTQKADSDLQNISGALTTAEQGTVRTRLDAQAEVDVPSQAEAEARIGTEERAWTSERVGQAIAAGVRGLGSRRATPTTFPSAQLGNAATDVTGKASTECPEPGGARRHPAGDGPCVRRLDAQQDLDVPSQAEAEAGTATDERVWTAERVAQAADARVSDWAQEGNTADDVPDAKLPDLITAGQIAAPDADTARVGVTPALLKDFVDTNAAATSGSDAGPGGRARGRWVWRTGRSRGTPTPSPRPS